MRRLMIAAVAALGLAAIWGIPVQASTPTPSGTLTLLTAQPIREGSTITFDATWSGLTGKGNPEVSVACTAVDGTDVFLQALTTVLTASGSWSPQFTLASPEWDADGDGPAACTAEFYQYVWQGHQEVGVNLFATVDFSTQ